MTGGSPAAERPDRAVIDIGSNTVRLVIYAGSKRVPRQWLNESVKARLGRDLATSGTMPAKSIRQALSALSRYAMITRDLGIEHVVTVATAAVRDAGNGAEFLDHVRGFGLDPRLLSGEDEARGAAFGVIGAFPQARGAVADLGGGSLELIDVADGACANGVSLPLGTLRLGALRSAGSGKLGQRVTQEIGRSGWAGHSPETLYLVGGTWRAFASYAIHTGGYPLSDAHGFGMDSAQAVAIGKTLSDTTPAALEGIPGISAARAASLPDAAALMRALLGELKPRCVVASGWGLREGLLFQDLEPDTRALDPLDIEIDDFAAPRGGSRTMAGQIALWLEPVIGAASPGQLPRVTAQLALAAMQVEPNLRGRQALEWAMDKRWVGLAPAGRAWVATALQAAIGRRDLPAALDQLAEQTALQQAAGWGLGIRLARRLSAGSFATLEGSSLRRDGSTLVLSLPPDRMDLASAKVCADLRTFANWLGLDVAPVQPCQQV